MWSHRLIHITCRNTVPREGRALSRIARSAVRLPVSEPKNLCVTPDMQRARNLPRGALGRMRRLLALGLWGLLVPFLLLSLLPTGVMPMRDRSGIVMLVICSGETMREIAVDAETLVPVDEDRPGLPPDTCIWAKAHAPMLASSPPPVPVFLGRVIRLEPAPPVAHLAIARATGLPPATGPPFSI